MNERIKELAVQAGFYKYGSHFEEIIERFAELVRQDLYQVIGKSVIEQINSAVQMEREACAKLCDARGNLHGGLFGNWAQDIAERIRARKESL